MRVNHAKTVEQDETAQASRTTDTYSSTDRTSPINSLLLPFAFSFVLFMIF